MFSLAFIRDNFTFILSALPVTLVITLLSLLFSTLLGAALAWVIIRQVPGVQWGAKVFLSFSRSVPVLVMLYFFFYVWPWIAAGLFGGPQDNMYHYKLSPLVAAVTALSLIFSAYFAETFRAGWNAVDKGQREAAWSIGLSGFTQFRRIIFPQAAVSALPNFTSVLIDLIKDTSLVYTITVIDLMAKANIAAARGFHFVEAYCVVLVIYIVLCLAIARALRSVERFLRARWQGPIVLLTSLDSDMNHILSLEMGANDYILKTTPPAVLLARLRLHLRQHVTAFSDASSPQLTPHKALRFGTLSIDPVNRQVLLSGEQVALSTADFDLLWELATHAGQIMDRDALLKNLRGVSYDGMDRSVDVAISRLRKKLLDNATEPFRIKTVRNKGYLFAPHAWDI